MLFIFENEEIQSMWMKDTLIPLDMIFISKELDIVDTIENTKPKSTKTLLSNCASKYVLEINAGLCEQHGIRFCDKVELI